MTNAILRDLCVRCARNKLVRQREGNREGETLIPARLVLLLKKSRNRIDGERENNDVESKRENAVEQCEMANIAQ